MKISLLTTTNSHLAGGLYNSVRNLGLAMLAKDADVNIVSYNDAFSADDLYAYGKLPMKIYHTTSIPLLSRLGYSHDLVKLLDVTKPDVIHSQGIWMYNSKAALDYKTRHRNSISITAPRGMLDPWALRQSAWLKKIVGRWFEYQHLNICDCIHALCESEKNSIRKFGLKNPVAIIPNGINLPKPFTRPPKNKRILLFISRIHLKKGLELLIDAIVIVNKEKPNLLSNWIVRIAGWNQLGYQEYLQKKVQELQLNKFISFIGPVLGEQKRNELINADAFVLPSYSEGLPMSILEAWSYSLPVVMTDFCNLEEGFSSNAAIRIELNARNIADRLISLFEMTEMERKIIGTNGYILVSSRFTWSTIADKVLMLYDYLLGGSSKPEFVV